MTDPERDDLCRRIAEARPDWARPGSACASDGWLWRLSDLDDRDGMAQWWIGWCRANNRVVSFFVGSHVSYFQYETDSLAAAICNGPDHRDATTVDADGKPTGRVACHVCECEMGES